jgi:hypothetical protein
VEGGSPGDPILRKIVRTALKSLKKLVDGDGRDAMLDASAKLLEKLGPAS